LQQEGKDNSYTEVFYKKGSSVKVCISQATEKQILSASKNGKTEQVFQAQLTSSHKAGRRPAGSR